MNPSMPGSALFWLDTIGTLALQAAGILLAAGALGRLLKSGRGRRAGWQAAFAAVGLLLAGTISGADRAAVRWLLAPGRAPAEMVVRPNLANHDSDRPAETGAAASSGLDRDRAADLGRSGQAALPIARWPAVLWLAGALVIGLWTLVARCGLARAWRGVAAAPPAAARDCIERLRGRLGLRRSVRFVESARLDGPVAFGIVRPTLGVPVGFWKAHTGPELDAMLAHELAHLAARDPLWHAFADLLTACFWWHPLAWWGRRQFRTASEFAADEASVLVENGPFLLAGCLVTLAARLARRGASGHLGMAGFRSGLGRRVEQLLRLPPDKTWTRDGTPGGVVLRSWTAIALVLAALLSVRLVRSQAAELPAVLTLMRESLRLAGLPGGADPAPGAPVQAVPPVGEGPLAPGEGAEGREPVAGAIPGALPAAAGLGTGGTSPPVGPVPVGPPTGSVAVPSREAGETTRLFTRSYRVNFEQIAANLATASGSVPTSGVPVEVAVLLRCFEAAGFDWGGSNGPPVLAGGLQSPTGKALFLNRNPSPGALLVRGTRADLDIVETCLSRLNAAPPQVLIEARLVEIAETAAGKDAGLDRYLGGMALTGVSDRFTDPASPQPQADLKTNASVRAVAPTASPGPSNPPRELRGDELEWPGRQATNAHGIRVEAMLGSRVVGVLTDPQFRDVLRALEQHPRVDVLSTPKLTTLSGRSAQIQVASVQTVLTGLNPDALVQSGTRPGTGVPAFISSTIPSGVTLEIQPVIGSDNQTIRIDVAATVAEFLGYDTVPKDRRVRVWDKGKPRWVTPPQPRFRVRQMTTAAQVPDGHTLVLGGMPIEEPGKERGGKAPSRGARVRKQILVFLTPTLIDPAGNRVHLPGEHPAGPSSASGPGTR
jgi:Zn-dependent protease with chaperone function